MAAYGRRQEREGSHSNPLNFMRESPKFFKFVLNPRDNKLRLPTEFVKRYGQSLPNRVFLNVPNGSVQEVELIQIDGETWLRRGWQEFKEKFLIGFGDVLFFEYDYNFDFNVHIFDVTGLEIEYPLDSAHKEGADHTEDDVSVEILDSPVARSLTKYNLRVKGSFLDCQSEHTTVKLGIGGTGGQAPDRAQRVLNKETCISYQGAKAFESDNPSLNSYYISFLQPSCIRSPCILSIPMLFARKHLPRRLNDIKLSVSDGKTWLVRCIFWLGNAKISAGWPDFVKSNALKVGDTCIFEVNKSNKLVWNVIIFRS